MSGHDCAVDNTPMALSFPLMEAIRLIQINQIHFQKKEAIVIGVNKMKEPQRPNQDRHVITATSTAEQISSRRLSDIEFIADCSRETAMGSSTSGCIPRINAEKIGCLYDETVSAMGTSISGKNVLRDKLQQSLKLLE